MSKGITEIAGESATAKTQICLQLSLTVQLPLEYGGLAGSAVYVATEDALPVKRLNQLIPHFKARFECMADVDLGSQIFSVHAATLEQLDHLIHSQLPNVSFPFISLFLLDTISFLSCFSFSSFCPTTRCDWW